MDKVFVKNLVVPCKVGVTQEERSKKQNVFIDIEVFCDLSQAGAANDLNKSISYSEIQELESLAEDVASLILKRSIACKAVVAVKKEKYAEKPMMGIEISRDRHG
jgi:dihydroneopterin aldolase